METNKMQAKPYKTFFLTLAISFVIMYAVMFLNVYDTSHIYISTNRLCMTLLMVSPMAMIMVGMMRTMYTNKRLNGIIMTGAVLVFIAAFAALRNQAFISDEEYMRGMIPHHSSAILTSSNANIKNPAVRKLADGIIESQKKEIEEMKTLLKSVNK